MSDIIIGVGELGASAKPGSTLKTYALGSCVAVLMYDPITRCVGMDHVALPDSSIKPGKARTLPGHFADTGVPALLSEMARAGAKGHGRGYIVKLVGGASVMDPNNTFNIGSRNVLAIRAALQRCGLSVSVEDVGGRISRTVSMSVDTGSVRVTSPGRAGWVL